MKDPRKRRKPIFKAFILSLPAIITLLVTPHIGEIIARFFNDNFNVSPPALWAVMLVIILVLLAVATYTIFSLRDLFAIWLFVAHLSNNIHLIIYV